MNAKPLLAAASLALAAAPASAAWVPTADSTTSAPKFTDGNFVISWNTGNRRFQYVSHDSAVSTVCDMTTFCTDCTAAGYTYPTRAATYAFSGKSGITRIVLPEECQSLYYNAFASMPDLESVVLPSGLRWVEGLSNHRAIFSSSPKLSSVTPRGVAETNGVAYWPLADIPPNTFQNNRGTALRHVIAPAVTSLGGDAIFQNCYGLETVTVKALDAVGVFGFNNCSSLTNIVVAGGGNPFAGLATFSREQIMGGCTAWTQPLDFSAATFTSIGNQTFYGCTRVSEYRMPATLDNLPKQAFRCDSYALSVPRRLWFYGPPPTSIYWSSGDPDYLFWAPATPRMTVFVPEQHAVAWTNAMSAHVAVAAVTDADRARADYPTKLADVKVKIAGKRYDLAPTKVKDSDVLCLSTMGSAGRPYYVVQWRETSPTTLILIH